MDIFAAYATDETREEDGAVVFLTSGQDPAVDPWIRVARLNNTAYSKGVTETYNKIQADRKMLKLSDAEVEIRSKNAMIELLAQTILKDFGNLEFQGLVLVPSAESKLMALRLKDFREMVVGHAANVDLYRVQQAEAAAGN